MTKQFAVFGVLLAIALWGNGCSATRRHLNARFQNYDKDRGGGIWFGKHYGRGGERIGDPVGDNSHAANVRQLLRYFLLLEQGELISPAASKTMREIFASPDIPHDRSNSSRHYRIET